MTATPQEAKSKVELAVKDILHTLKSTSDKENNSFPTNSIYIPSESITTFESDEHFYNDVYDAVEEVEFDNYHKAAIDRINIEDETISNAARIVHESEAWDVDGIMAGNRDYFYNFEDQSWDLDNVIDVYKVDILFIASSKAFLTDSLEFSNSEFDTVYNYFRKKACDEDREFSVFCPVMNVDGEFESIELPTDFDFKGVRGRYEIERAEMIPLSSSHLSGFFNYQDERRVPRVDPEYEYGWTHLIRIDMLGSPRNGAPRQYFKSLGRCLRLYKPEDSVAYMGPAFTTDDILYQERFGIPRFTFVSPPELSIGNVYTSKTYGLATSGNYSIQTSEKSSLSNFIARYLNRMNPEGDGQLVNTLRRFDEMYSNLYLEDKLVNGMVGFEGSLLRDVGRSSSFTFRLKLRSGPVLENFDVSRDEAHEFFKSLYHIRGEIVHNDRDLDEIIETIDFQPDLQTMDEEEDPALLFSRFTRVVLSNIIIFYNDIKLDIGLGVTEVNKKIDEKALDVRVEFDGL